MEIKAQDLRVGDVILGKGLAPTVEVASINRKVNEIGVLLRSGDTVSYHANEACELIFRPWENEKAFDAYLAELENELLYCLKDVKITQHNRRDNSINLTGLNKLFNSVLASRLLLLCKVIDRYSKT